MSPQKVAIVTGANTGIGRETALALAKKEMKVFLACRNVDKGRDAVNYILDACPGADVELLHLDLQSMDSVRKCASEFKSRKLPLNILVNNAGIADGDYLGPEGVTLVRQVNFLGPYTFTRLLEGELTLGAPSRVVNVTSVMHRLPRKFNPEEYCENKKTGLYSNSKLANVMFTHEAQLRWHGQGIESCAVDPGSVASGIFKYQLPLINWLVKVLYAPTWDGAKTVVHAATAPYGDQKKDNMPFRFFARGFYAYPVIILAPLVMPTKARMFAMLLGSFIDWHVRKLSRGAFWSEVKEVPANKQAYDREKCSRLWKKAAVLAGLEEK